MDSHLREFLAEAEDSLEALFDDLRALRANRTVGRARRELVARIFRRTHTIKGGAATVELSAVASLAHEFETLLDSVRLGRATLDEDVLDAFEDAAQMISQSLHLYARGEEQSPDQFLIERLRRLARLESDDAARPDAQKLLAALPEDMARSLGQHELNRILESMAEGARLFIVSVKFALETFDERFRDLSRALAGDGEIVSTLPGVEGASAEEISFRIIYAARMTVEELTARAGAFEQLSVIEINTEQSAEPEQGENARPVFKESSVASAPDETRVSVSKHVRVELNELDEIIAATHEVLIDATATLDSALTGDLQAAGRRSTENRAEKVRRRLLELEGRLIGLRMVPVAQLLERAARVGSATARQTGKEIDFELRGTDISLDKTLADAIADPLLHMLRNAVDHGIETVKERAAAGKRRRGLIRLEAVAESNRVKLRISDDGRGIDPLRVTRAASAQGLIETDETLTKEQALRLIFRPGFSTRSTVSNVSGRGVGLDVVENVVEQMGGQLRITSEPGQGTTFEIILPVTLALIQAYVVRSGIHRYCVDASYVNEIVSIAPSEIEGSGATAQFRFEGKLLPLVGLRQLLAQSPQGSADTDAPVPAIVVSRAAGDEAFENRDRKQAAILVDSVDGEIEALVRGLGRHAARWRGVSGATALRDGSVALVLDLPSLLEKGKR